MLGVSAGGLAADSIGFPALPFEVAFAFSDLSRLSSSPHLQPRILKKIPHHNLERQTAMLDRSLAPQQRFGNCGHLIELRIGRVDDGEFHQARILGIIFRVALRQAHVTFDREEIGKQTAGEHDDEARVRKMNAELAPGPTETFRVRGDQIDQQHRADEMASRKNWNLGRPSGRQTNKL